MAILVSDANIFIDMDVGNLTRPMFRLDDEWREVESMLKRLDAG